jgi:DNA-binding transcriptional regulator YdaS (Cro superfamily)
MYNLTMNASELFSILGGPTKIAKLCNISVPAVSMWRKTGIPAERLIFLAARIEKETEGKISRKHLFPESWQDIWVELR